MLCKECGIQFVKTGQHQLFHSPECRKKFFFSSENGLATKKREKESNKSIFNYSYKDRAKKICLKCGKSFMSEGKYNRRCLECKRQEDQHGAKFLGDFL